MDPTHAPGPVAAPSARQSALAMDAAEFRALGHALIDRLATILSVMSLRPKILKPPTTIQPNTNIVFFGSFTGIPEEQYISHVVDVMRSEEKTYRAMARDLYQNGQVLQRKKYRYLSYAYSSFLIGIVATFAVFLIEMAVEAMA